MPTVRQRKPQLRPTAIVGSLWLLCVVLFLTQYLILLDKAAEDAIVSVKFLVTLLMALPGSILLLVDWLRYALPERAAPVAARAAGRRRVWWHWLADKPNAGRTHHLPLKIVLFAHGIVLLGQLTGALEAAISHGIPVPCMTSALTLLDGYTSAQLPANLLQAQRDYFGAHTYERTDQPRGKYHHTNWTGSGGDTASTTYDA